MSSDELKRVVTEVRQCRRSLSYFATTSCQILASSDRTGGWMPFHLWPAQTHVAADLETHREVIALKARQLGLTWLVVALALRELLFNPVATVLFFSKTDDEAMELVGFRLREMHARLPGWMRTDRITADNAHEFAVATGSRALAFSTAGGRSYTATLAIIDEADHVPNNSLQRMLSAIKPCIDAGGRLLLLSTVDKGQPESPFKRLYRAARAGDNSFHPVFLPWAAAPWRTQGWYAEKRQTILTATGSEDDLWQEYPATEAEALAPRQLDKRIPSAWLMRCFVEARPIDADRWYAPAYRLPAIPGLVVYARPQPGRAYVIGGDPAEGNPTSDDSALAVLDAASGEEVATLAGKLEPTVFAGYIGQLAGWYNGAAVLVERNNHGHAVLAGLDALGLSESLLGGHDGKAGWMSSTLGKVKLYDACADAVRNREVVIHHPATFHQLASIDGSTLRAPDGQHDDKAGAFALACAARLQLSAATADDYPALGAGGGGYQSDLYGGGGGGFGGDIYGGSGGGFDSSIY
jgi:hypothetical protein